MNLMFDARFITPQKTGVGKYTSSLLSGLSRPCFDFNITAVYYDEIHKSPNICYIKAPFRFDNHPLGDLYRNLGLYNIVLKNKVDVFFSPAYYCFQRRVRIPQIITIHDLAVYDIPESFNRKFVFYLKFMIREACTKAHRIITFSEFIASRIRTRFPSVDRKIRIIPCSVGQEFFQKNPSAELRLARELALPEEFILIISTVEPRKNLLNLLKSYAIYRRRSNNPLPLIIVGKDGFQAEKVHRRAMQKDCENSVRFLGYVHDSRIALLYNLATFSIYPSLYEGFGLPVVESMAAGCPVIASNCSSIPEVCGESAYLIDPHSIESVSEAMIQMSDDQDLRDLYVRKANERVTLFQEENVLKQYYDVLHE